MLSHIFVRAYSGAILLPECSIGSFHRPVGKLNWESGELLLLRATGLGQTRRSAIATRTRYHVIPELGRTAPNYRAYPVTETHLDDNIYISLNVNRQRLHPIQQHTGEAEGARCLPQASQRKPVESSG
jgi:hypothetical protein